MRGLALLCEFDNAQRDGVVAACELRSEGWSSTEPGADEDLRFGAGVSTAGACVR